MSQHINLKEIERKAWRSTFQDGLWDIYLGMLLFSMALSTIFEATTLNEAWRYVIYFGFIVLAMLILWAGKRFITLPCMGRVKYGLQRQSRIKKVRLMLFASVAFGLIVFFVSLSVWRGDFGKGLPWDVIFPLLYALNMLVVFGLGAYFLDFPRLYLIAVLFALPLPVTVLARQFLGVDLVFLAFAVPALIIIGVGVYFLAHFLRENPVRETHDDFAGNE